MTIGEAREFMERARGMERRIEALRDRRRRYEALAGRVTARYGAGPGGGSGGSGPVEEYACRIADLSRDIDARLEAYAGVVREIQGVIDALEDPRYRDVLTLRYLNDWPWERVAKAMGYDQRWVLRLHAEALGRVAAAL